MAGSVVEAVHAGDGAAWELVVESSAADPVGLR